MLFGYSLCLEICEILLGLSPGTSLFLLNDLLQDTNPKNQQQPLNTTDFRISTRSPHPLVGRPGGRPTLPPTGRPGAQKRVGCLQSVDSVDRPVDRTSDTAGGRPGRSTAQPVLLLLCYFLLLFSSPFVVDFLGDHLDNLSLIHI